jgi:hypothetical protein
MSLIKQYGIKSLFEVPSTSWLLTARCVSRSRDDMITVILWLCCSAAAALAHWLEKKDKAMSAP